ISARASPEIDTPSRSATTWRGCGPLRRSSRSHSGGSACRASSSCREPTPARNSSGVASRCTPSFFAAVAGFIVWVDLCRVTGSGYRGRAGRYPGLVTGPSDTAVFRLGYVPGVTPGKWVRIWAERRPDVPLELVTATTDEAAELIRTKIG